MSKAEAAVSYILERVVDDPNFAWYMFGTQALALCYEAEAERTGKTRKELEPALIESAQRRRNEQNDRRPDVVVLQEAFDTIRGIVFEYDALDDADSTVEKLQAAVSASNL